MLPPFLSPYFRAVQNCLPRRKWCRRWSQKRDIRYNKGSRRSQARERVKPFDLWELGLYLSEWRRLSCGSPLHRLWTNVMAKPQRREAQKHILRHIFSLLFRQMYLKSLFFFQLWGGALCGSNPFNQPCMKNVFNFIIACTFLSLKSFSRLDRSYRNSELATSKRHSVRLHAAWENRISPTETGLLNVNSLVSLKSRYR